MLHQNNNISVPFWAFNQNSCMITMKSRNMVLINRFAGQEERCRHRPQACGHSRGRRGWDELRE